MSIFLLIYFLVLGFFHYFFYLKLRLFFIIPQSAKAIYIIVSIFLIFLPIISRVLEKNNFIIFATIFLYLFYFWLAYLFIFNFFGIAFLPFYLIKNLKIIMNKILFLLPFIIIIAGFIQDKFLNVKYFEIKSEKIKKPLKIGFMSDLHLGLTQSKKKLDKIIRIFEREKIDILLGGGDFLDSSYHKDNENILKNFNPPFGKYTVFGNHEWYVGIEKSKSILENLGFKVLRFEKIDLEGDITIAGAEEETAKYFNSNYNEKDFLKNLSKDKFVIYLRHRPPKERLEKVNLILSGHTHKGQFFPFSIITSLFFKYHSGFYKLDDSSYIYVSSGAGSWGPPVRFLTTRDIAVIKIIPALNSN